MHHTVINLETYPYFFSYSANLLTSKPQAKKEKKQIVKRLTWAILSYGRSYIDENGQKIKFLNDIFKPNNVATSVNAEG